MIAPTKSGGTSTVTFRYGSSIFSISPASGMSCGEWIASTSPLVLRHAVLDRRRRREQVEVELALEPLLDDLHVQQPEESAAEPEPERVAALRLVDDRRVVQPELVERVAQLRVLVAVDREQARVHHRLHVAVARQRLARAVLRVRDRVADLHERRVLEAGDEVADLADARARPPGRGPAGARRPPPRRCRCPPP